jgi:AraC family transcriptional regulator, regulatory protein of adaptative response / DNA-3-methyladenine glycosylase II
MMLDPDFCYRAAKARDSRFDGRFFIGVSSTRIYCRPICTVKTPMRKNCTFYPSAAAAEAAGYRPCLRCRPELAPGNASVDAARRLAHAAASLIEDGTLADTNLDALAARLGVTDRHLRRVFQAEFGVAPVAYAQTQRLLLAKRLLTDTVAPITDVAFAAGFQSLRRFNALFKSRYRLCPRDLRKNPPAPRSPEAHRFELSYRPPYDWNGIVAFLGARCVRGVEEASASAYRRVVRIVRDSEEQLGWIEVAPAKRKSALQVLVSASLMKVMPAVLGRVKHLMDIAANPAEISEVIGALAAERPGLRVPGAFDGFEIAVRAILGQQISVAAARTIAGRFAAAFGAPVETPFESLKTAFPSPERIAELSVSENAILGIIAVRAHTIIELAREIARGDLVLSAGADVAATLTRLRQLPGVGEWTAQYIAMRALAWPDAFPHTDLGLMRALGERDPKRILAAGEAWRPWRSYAVMHLWASESSQPAAAPRRIHGTAA